MLFLIYLTLACFVGTVELATESSRSRSLKESTVMGQHQTLFGLHPEAVHPDDISRALEYGLPAVQNWLLGIVDSQVFPLLIRACLKSGNARNGAEAVLFLVRCANEYAGDPSIVRWSDLKGQYTNYMKLRLLRALEPEANTRPRIVNIRNHGTIGHKVAGLVTQRLLPSRYEEVPTPPQATDQLLLIQPHDVVVARDYPDAITNSDWVSERHMRRIQRMLTSIAHETAAAKAWHGYTQAGYPLLSHLRDLLRPIYGLAVDKLRSADPYGIYLELITLQTWARLVIYAHSLEQSRILFTEVPLMSSDARLGLGRIDALEVVSVDGHSPTANERRRLRYLATQRYGSVQHLLTAIFQHLGRDIGLHVLDWKMAVGDHPDPQGIIDVAKIRTRPIPKHATQVSGYMAFSRHALILGDNWQADLFAVDGITAMSGAVMYCVPGHAPICHDIDFAPETEENLISHSVLKRIPQAIHRAANREILGKVSNVVLQDLGGTKTPKRKKQRCGTTLSLDL